MAVTPTVHALRLAATPSVPDVSSGSPATPTTVVVDEFASATSPSSSDESAGPLHALLAIERSVSSVRIVPILAVIGALWWGQVVLIPIVLALLISYALEP